MKGKTLLLVLAASALAASAAMPSDPAIPARAADEGQATAELVVVHAKVWTGDAARPEAEALAVRGDRLVAVGDDAEIRALVGAGTRVIDARGRRVLPGLHDAHLHLISGGFSLLAPVLRDAASRDEFVRRLAAYAASLPAGRWIRDGRWDHENWPGSPLPERGWIDEATGDHPLLLSRIDGHMALANSRALALAGVGRATPDPDGGTIVRAADGEPTGVLKDAAIDLVAKAIPERSPEELRAALDAAMREANRLGLTSVHDIAGWTEWPAYIAARAEGALTVRLFVRTPLASWDRQRDLVAWGGGGDAWLRLAGFKAYADGSLGSSTALFFAPYADLPSTSGLLADDFFPEGIFERRVGEADRAGLQVSTHAIGEKANAIVLDVYERVARAGGARDRRFRIEHAQHLRREEIRRFGPLGVVASMQPVHLADDGRWAGRRLGPERVNDSYAFRSLLDAGARLAFGSDWPVAPLDPMQGVAAAVARRTDDGLNPDGWIPPEKIGVAEALRAYTADAAWATFAEADLGSLAPGKLADFVVLAEDPLTVAPERLPEIRVDLTAVGGRVVFERGAAPPGR